MVEGTELVYSESHSPFNLRFPVDEFLFVVLERHEKVQNDEEGYVECDVDEFSRDLEYVWNVFVGENNQ